MTPPVPSTPESRIVRGMQSWAVFVVRLQVGAGVVGVVVMGYFAIVATGQRLVPLLALPVLVFFIAFRLKQLRALHAERAKKVTP
jgi:hypothetical protein